MIFYGPKEAPEVKELGQKSPEPSTRVGARPTSLGIGRNLVDDSENPLMWDLRKKIPKNIETPENNLDREFLRRKPL